MQSIENNIRVVIADDEPLARQLLTRLVEVQPGMKIVGVAKDGESAGRMIADMQADLAFLDVEMPKLSGVDLIATWGSRAEKPYVVFVTAYDRYAIRAFDLDAIDYLVKPIGKQRFARSVERARKAICAARVRRLGEKIAAATAPELIETAPPSRNRHILVRHRDELLRLPENEIFWLEAASQYVRIHTASAHYIVAEPLNRYYAKLDSNAFVRVHRSAVVNVNIVQRILKKPNGLHELHLNNGVRVPLSRSRRAMVGDLLNACARNRMHA